MSGVLLGDVQKATRALRFTDALLWSLPSTKPLFGGSEQGPTQTLPGDQLQTEKKIMCLTVEKMLRQLLACGGVGLEVTPGR